MDEFDKLVESFNYYDEDRSGYITTNEMPRMVEALGENPNLDNLKQAILAFDTNQDGQISFQEFLSWWKLGRRDPFAFVKFYELGNYIDNQVKLVFNSTRLLNAMSNTSEEVNKKTTTADISLDTKTIEEYSTRLQLKLAIGGKAREEYCKNYLSRYNDKLEYNDDDFIDFAVFVQSGTIHGMSARDYIEEFKNQIIDKLDKSYIPGIKNFLSNFMIVKVFNQDFSVNVRFEFKYDIQELLKAAFMDYLNITTWLTNNGKSPLSLDLVLFNGKNLSDLTGEDATLYDLLDKCELKIKFQAIKDKIRTILVNLNSNFQEIGKFFQPIVISSSVKLKYQGNINQYDDVYSKEILEKKTTLFKDIVAFFKSNIPNDLRKVMSRLEIGLNIIDTFASIQLFSENHWAD
jgi:hypothetical protein